MKTPINTKRVYCPMLLILVLLKITPTDLTGWKNSNVSKVNHQIKTEYEELKLKYEKLMVQYEYNNLIYSAEFSFEPIVGQVYHLYENKKGKIFLSIISPYECNLILKEVLNSMKTKCGFDWILKENSL